MSNYNWLAFADGPAALRYPIWVEGAALWREAAGGSEETLDAVLTRLIAARASVTRGEPGTELSVPRLFISHRRSDEARARDVGVLARQEGFQVWLDALDAAFQGLVSPGAVRRSTPREVAIYIETALLNCTHVIALITPNTRGTMWVPYEYGRVKDSSPNSLQAACWMDPTVTDPPEYLELGVKTTTDDEIRAWLRQELAGWAARYPAIAAPVAAATSRRPTPEELEEIMRPFRDGIGTITPAPTKAKFRKK